MDNELIYFSHIAQGRIRLQDAINMLKDLDNWTIIIGDNHLHIQEAVKHLEALHDSLSERHVLAIEMINKHTTENDNKATGEQESE